jgi:hypothetical protein
MCPGDQSAKKKEAVSMDNARKGKARRERVRSEKRGKKGKERKEDCE